MEVTRQLRDGAVTNRFETHGYLVRFFECFGGVFRPLQAQPIPPLSLPRVSHGALLSGKDCFRPEKQSPEEEKVVESERAKTRRNRFYYGATALDSLFPVRLPSMQMNRVEALS